MCVTLWLQALEYLGFVHPRQPIQDGSQVKHVPLPSTRTHLLTAVLTHPKPFIGCPNVCREFPTVVAKLHEIGAIIKANSLSKVHAAAAVASAHGGYAGLGYAGLDRRLTSLTASED
eukprot:SAG22_NODE_1960_length_3248_cov_2.405208_4_plen_117_part_00